MNNVKKMTDLELLSALSKCAKGAHNPILESELKRRQMQNKVVRIGRGYP